MADDIDIEEHDLMENPRLKSMFPDLSILKEEILDPYDSDKNQDALQISKEYGSINPSFLVTKTEPELAETGISSTEFASFNVNESVNCETNFQTRIIIGSKPCRSKEYHKNCVSVRLENIQNYLVRSGRYCNICSRLFSCQQSYRNHLLCEHSVKQQKENFNNKKVMQSSFKNVESVKRKFIHKCFHCNVSFPNQKNLIDHLYDVLESKTLSKSKNIEDECITNLDNLNSDTNNDLTRNIGNGDKIYVYQCHICSYYFNQTKFYEMHLFQKHGLKNMSNVPKVIFNPECKYCYIEYINVNSYNLHMIKKHKDIVTKTVGNTSCHLKYEDAFRQSKASKEDDPGELLSTSNIVAGTSKNNHTAKSVLNDGNLIIFKSIIFKCLECHIHFLSSHVAVNHVEHNQMLINWKCPKCLKFFKRNDENSHLEQHLHSTSFKVCELSAADAGKVLIKCHKCTIHFHEDDFVHHFSLCENVQLTSVYCSCCDILVNDKIMKLHQINHKTKKMSISDFIFIDYSKQEMTPLNWSCKKLSKRTKGENKSIIPSKRVKTNLDYTSSSDSDSTPLSVLEKSKSTKRVVTGSNNSTDDESLSTTLMPNDENVSDDADSGLDLSVSLKHTNDMKKKVLKRSRSEAKSNKFKYKHVSQLCLLHLTYCDFCECFITVRFHVDFHLKSRCTEIQKRVCKICGIVVTGKASTSHKAFHKLNPKLKLKDFKFYDIKTSKIIPPPIPKYPKCDICEVHFTSKNDVKAHVCSTFEFKQCDVCNIKLSDIALGLHMPFHSYVLTNKKGKSLNFDTKISLVIQNDTDNIKSKKSDSMVINEIVLQPQTHVGEHSLGFIFSCKICNISVNTYDDLIGHCHLHFIKDTIDLKTEECQLCSLKFETCSYQHHQNLHSQGMTKESFKIIYIDVFYFGSSNEEWTKYVFDSLSKEEQAMILEKSIYKCESRIKMEITQQGSWDLTMYKCEKCRCFVDSIFIYKHFKNCIGKQATNPCKFCGINLMSMACRNEHELIVHARLGVTLKSYRIVLFNRKEDKVINDAIANKNYVYVLYKCRNCNVITDKNALNHECYFGNIKKCIHCGLLINEDCYDQHVKKHEKFDSFKESNIKVILVGNKKDQSHENKLECSYKGIVYDYTFYKCIKCKVCIRHLRPSSKHFCFIDVAKSMCPKCHLYFDEGKLKYHLKQHSTDPDFVRDNMLILDFDPDDQSKCLENEESKVRESNTKSDNKNKETSIIEKTDTVYKCACDLHHLTRLSFNEHNRKNQCSKKKGSRQKCFKCGLEFTPNILFKHLLIHHGDINVVYNLSIVKV